MNVPDWLGDVLAAALLAGMTTLAAVSAYHIGYANGAQYEVPCAR